jgi:hypothetical protein
MKYISTRGGDQSLTFEEVSSYRPLPRHKIADLLLFLLFLGRLHWSCPQRWSLHPRTDPATPSKLAIRLARVLLPTARHHPPVSLHSGIGDSGR